MLVPPGSLAHRLGSSPINVSCAPTSCKGPPRVPAHRTAQSMPAAPGRLMSRQHKPLLHAAVTILQPEAVTCKTSCRPGRSGQEDAGRPAGAGRGPEWREGGQPQLGAGARTGHSCVRTRGRGAAPVSGGDGMMARSAQPQRGGSEQAQEGDIWRGCSGLAGALRSTGLELILGLCV